MEWHALEFMSKRYLSITIKWIKSCAVKLPCMSPKIHNHLYALRLFYYRFKIRRKYGKMFIFFEELKRVKWNNWLEITTSLLFTSSLSRSIIMVQQLLDKQENKYQHTIINHRQSVKKSLCYEITQRKRAASR